MSRNGIEKSPCPSFARSPTVLIMANSKSDKKQASGGPKTPTQKTPPEAVKVAPPPAAKVEFQTLASLRVKLGEADPQVRAEIYDGVSEGELLAEGKRIASDVLVVGVTEYATNVLIALGALSAEQKGRLVGFDESFLPVMIDETAGLETLVTRSSVEGITVDVTLAERRAEATAAVQAGVALRDQAVRSLRRVLRGSDTELKALDQAVGSAETAATLADGLEFVSQQIIKHADSGSELRRSFMARVKLTKEYAATLSAASKRVLATDKAASATAQTGVSQRMLDLQDGRIMRVIDQVNRAFRDANGVDDSIPVPGLGSLESYFVNTRRAAKAPDPPTPPQPPTG